MINETLDITSVEYTQNPYPWYEQLRQKGNVHYLTNNQSWLVIGFAECIEILNNPHLFSSVGKHQFDPILLNCDPPKHTYHKRILSGEGAPFQTIELNNWPLKTRRYVKNNLTY